MPAGVFGHLWRALRRALAKVLASTGIAAIATVLTVEVVAYFAAGANALLTPTTHLAALALALAIGYAVGFLTLIFETIALLAEGARDVERAGVSGVEKLERIKQPS